VVAGARKPWRVYPAHPYFSTMARPSGAASVATEVEGVWLDPATISLDPEVWRANRLTESERRSFSQLGYLLLDGDALPPAVLGEVTAALEALREAKLAEGREADEVIRQSGFSAANQLQESDALPNLLSTNAALPKAVVRPN